MKWLGAMAAVPATLLLASSSVGAQTAQPACLTTTCTTPRLVYFGMRDGGPGKGIMSARFDARTGKFSGLGLAAEVDRPTWLLPSARRGTLYSVSELGNEGKENGYVVSLAVNPRTGKLAQTSKVDAGGGGTTHLVFANARSLLASNFGGGSVTVVPVLPNGRLAPPTYVQTEKGSGPNPRQQSAHAHGALIDKSGRYVLVADLGADKVFVYRFDPRTGKTAPHAEVAVKPGTGPRHLISSPDGRFIYGNLELSAEIVIFRWDSASGTLTPITAMSALPAGYTGARSAGEIGLSPDGRFFYVTNRGEDTIVTYSVNKGTGALTELQRISAGGQAPWNFALDPSGRWMLVANETSGEVRVFRRDPARGTLAPTEERIAVPHASYVAIYGD